MRKRGWVAAVEHILGYAELAVQEHIDNVKRFFGEKAQGMPGNPTACFPCSVFVVCCT
jgi:hypothetical protein